MRVDGVSTTLAMMKPDGVVRPEVASAVQAGFADRQVSVTCCDELLLTHPDVAELFPAFRACPITMSLLTAYLTSGPVRILVVDGIRVIEQARAVRAEVRARFARSSFANCIHVASDADEAAVQLRWLAQRLGRPLPRLPDGSPAEPKLIPGAAGTLARLGDPALRELGARIWRTANGSGWEGHWRLPPGVGDWTVVVDTEEVNSIDSAASHLLEAVPGLSAESAVYAALEVDRAGSAPLYRGESVQAHKICESLLRRGLLARATRTPVETVTVRSSRSAHA